MESITKISLALFLVLAAGVGLIVATPVVAHAAGLNNEKNFGQCKKDFPNGNGCNSTVKPGNG